MSISSDHANQYIRENYIQKSDEELGRHLGLSKKAVKERRARMGLSKSTPESTLASSSEDEVAVTILQRLLKENGVSLSEVGSVKLSSYQQGQKNADGESEVVNLGGAAVTLKFDSNLTEGPQWPVVQQAKPVKLPPVKAKKRKTSELKTAVLLPDCQIGFRRDIKTGELDPFHDEAAMQVALSIIEDIQPDLVVNMGDFLDLPTFGRFDQEPGFALTTQAAVDAGHEFLCQQLAASNHAPNVFMLGNHDQRLSTFVQKNAMAAFGLQRANAPEEWPVMSVPYLLRLDELGVECIDGYPAGEYWINDRLKIEHGNKTAPRGKIANKIVTDERVSVITGHNHRIETVYKTTDTKEGPKVNLGMTIGTLARIDGAVPSTKSTIDYFGRTVRNVEDWQQAVGVVEYVQGDGPFSVTPVLIHEGKAIYNGNIYES